MGSGIPQYEGSLAVRPLYRERSPKQPNINAIDRPMRCRLLSRIPMVTAYLNPLQIQHRKGSFEQQCVPVPCNECWY